MKNCKLKIKVKKEELLPFYASEKAAGADLKADVDESIFLKPGKTALIPTGIFLEIPDGFEVQIRPRSGLALKHSISVLNTPGTIDADYRGEIKVILINHSKETFEIKPFMRIAQMVLCPVYQANFELQKELLLTSRGENGFGSSGER